MPGNRYASLHSPFLPVTLALFASVLLASCDGATLDAHTERSANQSPLAPNVRMQVSFDQREVTYSNVLPPGLVGDVSPVQTNAQSEGDRQTKGVMESYEVTRETRSYDEEGYLRRTYTYTDGHQGLNMPEAAYVDLKDQMPRRAEPNPVVTFKLEGGTMQYIREDGTVAASASVNPEHFQIDPAALDSLEALQESNASSGERAAQTRQRLQQRGVSLTRMSEHHVSFKTRSIEKGLSRIRRVVDLRTGKPIYLAYLREDGQPERIVLRTYGRYSEVPVMRREVAYEYGNKSGEWTVTSRTETTRTNISVRFN